MFLSIVWRQLHARLWTLLTGAIIFQSQRGRHSRQNHVPCVSYTSRIVRAAAITHTWCLSFLCLTILSTIVRADILPCWRLSFLASTILATIAKVGIFPRQESPMRRIKQRVRHCDFCHGSSAILFNFFSVDVQTNAMMWVRWLAGMKVHSKKGTEYAMEIHQRCVELHLLGTEIFDEAALIPNQGHRFQNNNPILRWYIFPRYIFGGDPTILPLHSNFCTTYEICIILNGDPLVIVIVITTSTCAYFDSPSTSF